MSQKASKREANFLRATGNTLEDTEVLVKNCRVKGISTVRSSIYENDNLDTQV